MYSARIPRFGTWTAPGQTQNAGTAIVVPIRPSRGPGAGPPVMYGLKNLKADWYGQPVTKVTHAVITSGSTAHTWVWLRPKNWTYINEAVTKNDTTVVMYDNPGTYSANYKYPLPPGVSSVPGLVADNTPASGDYVGFQLDNGAWHFSLVSSLSSLTLTIATGTPNVDGSTAAVGRILFFFGAAADVDPATGVIDPVWLPPASATTTFAEPAGLVSALHPGDPLILYNANASNASTLVSLAGAFDKD